MSTSTTLKRLVLAAVVCVAIELPAQARWVHVEVGPNKAIVYFGYNTKGFGVRGQIVEPVGGTTSRGMSYSAINYGAGSFIVWLPFWGAVSILIAVPVFEVATALLVASRFWGRRRHEVVDARSLEFVPSQDGY